jgi:hypothetical protein
VNSSSAMRCGRNGLERNVAQMTTLVTASFPRSRRWRVGLMRATGHLRPARKIFARNHVARVERLSFVEIAAQVTHRGEQTVAGPE